MESWNPTPHEISHKHPWTLFLETWKHSKWKFQDPKGGSRQVGGGDTSQYSWGVSPLELQRGSLARQVAASERKQVDVWDTERTERERERKTERETERLTDWEREKDGERDRETDRLRERERERLTDWETSVTDKSFNLFSLHLFSSLQLQVSF